MQSSASQLNTLSTALPAASQPSSEMQRESSDHHATPSHKTAIDLLKEMIKYIDQKGKVLCDNYVNAKNDLELPCTVVLPPQKYWDEYKLRALTPRSDGNNIRERANKLLGLVETQLRELKKKHSELAPVIVLVCHGKFMRKGLCPIFVQTHASFLNFEYICLKYTEKGWSWLDNLDNVGSHPVLVVMRHCVRMCQNVGGFKEHVYAVDPPCVWSTDPHSNEHPMKDNLSKYWKPVLDLISTRGCVCIASSTMRRAIHTAKIFDDMIPKGTPHLKLWGKDAVVYIPENEKDTTQKVNIVPFCYEARNWLGPLDLKDGSAALLKAQRKYNPEQMLQIVPTSTRFAPKAHLF